MYNNLSLFNANGINCQLELGNWSISKINHILNNAQRYSFDPSQKIMFIIQHFMGTPFIFDAQLPIAKKGILKVRLESFDSLTFVHNMLSLSHASSFEEFIKNLYEIEFAWTEKNVIDNDPDKGNRLSLACESILINAINKKYLRDITNELIASDKLDTVEINIKRYQRPKKFDQKELFVSPKYGSGIKREQFITINNIGRINKDLVKTGDIVLLTKGEISNRGVKQDVLVNHLVFAYKQDNEIYFIHASKDFMLKSSGTSNISDFYSRVYYDPKHQREQLGVSFGGKYLGEELNIHMNGIDYWAYDPFVKESLINYVEQNYWGAKFLRAL